MEVQGLVPCPLIGCLWPGVKGPCKALQAVPLRGTLPSRHICRAARGKTHRPRCPIWVQSESDTNENFVIIVNYGFRGLKPSFLTFWLISLTSFTITNFFIRPTKSFIKSFAFRILFYFLIYRSVEIIVKRFSKSSINS